MHVANIYHGIIPILENLNIICIINHNLHILCILTSISPAVALLASKLSVRAITVLRTTLLAVARSPGKRDVCLATVAKEIYIHISCLLY